MSTQPTVVRPTSLLDSAKGILASHPGAAKMDHENLLRCIEACFSAAQVCVTCADACLGESESEMLLRCIRLEQDCADICSATAKVLSRQITLDWEVAHAMLTACAVACRACATECAKHSRTMEHCRLCEQACRKCEEACHQLSAQPVRA